MRTLKTGPVWFSLLVLVIFSASQAIAGTILVTSSADAGPGSLRQAVMDARSGDTIGFAPEIKRIELAGGEIVVGKVVEIRGPLVQSPGEQLILDAGGTSRLFRVVGLQGEDAPPVVISDLALTGGSARGENGGAIFNEGNLRLLRCSIYGNVASTGPGDGGNGGGVANSGTLMMEACTLYQNRAVADQSGVEGGNGGGIYNGWGGAAPVIPTVHLLSSTVSGNEASALADSRSHSGEGSPFLRALAERRGLGGGLFNDTRPSQGAFGVDSVPGLIELEHATVTANTASSGGGVANVLLMADETRSPGESLGGALLLRGSIVGGNIASLEGGVPDLLGDGLALDSVIGSHLGNLGGRRNVMGHDAGLKPLADNGGPTLTHALEAWSPAVNAGTAECDHPVDQTGASRTVAGRSDSGATENSTPPLPLRKGHTAAYQDRDGDPVHIVLTGPGEGYATVAQGADAVDIVLDGTTGATELQVGTAGSTTIRNIRVTGAMRSLRAPNVDLLGSLAVTGGVKTLVLRDILGPSEITVGAAPGKGMHLRFRNVKDLVLKTGGKIRSFSAESWDGSGDGAHDLLQANRMGEITIGGWARKLRVVSEGNVDKVKVGGFEKSYVLAGATVGLMGLANPEADLSGDAKLKVFTVTGAVHDEAGFSFVDGILGAQTMDELSLGAVSGHELGSPCGLSANSIKDLRYSLGGQYFHFKKLEDFGQSIRSGPFTVSLDSTADLGFSFGALDDTRSDLWLPGVALQHLGLVFKGAAEDHCRFMLVPGDFATGYMGLCMSEAACQAFDPKGTISQTLSDIQYPEFVALAALYGFTLGDNAGQPATLYPTRGNHECYLKGDLTRTQWTKYIGAYLPQNGPTKGTGPDENPEMDERGFTYSFTYGNSMFLGLDEYAALNDKDNGVSPPPSVQVPSVFSNGWVSEQIAAYKADPSLGHLFAFGHSPLYTVQMDTSMDATATTAAGRDAFVQEASGSVEIYFCGHEHFYDHTIIGGTELPGGNGIDAMHQVLVGTGGAEIDSKTQDDCHYSASYIRDPSRQYYHSPEVPSSGNPQGYIGYNLVTVSGASVSFIWKAWHVNNPCLIFGHAIIPCGLCPSCAVDETPVVKNAWNYSVVKN
jgi:hypothetical protein